MAASDRIADVRERPHILQIMTIEPWQTRAPDLIAEVLIYLTEDGGRSTAIQPGYGCPCFTEKQTRDGGWDARLQLGDRALEPGIRLQVGFVFLSSEGAEIMRRARKFYLWEGRFIGEASVTD